jgi:uncharacterized protein YdeI (YjbR/CyaY-like superfamily)
MAAGPDANSRISHVKPRFFATPLQFHNWLARNHDSEKEILVGFHKKTSGKKSITYPEALDEALCFGWIDGVRGSLNDDSYTIRFTPRRPKSIWSLVNVRHIERLRKEGRMQPSGTAAFEARDAKRTGIYSFENRPRELASEYQKIFRANKKAWEFFKAQAPFYQRTVAFWVMSAKKAETQMRRLKRLIDCSARGERVGILEPKKKF